MKYDILYRGYLASCNYDCPYCPFGKQHDDKSARHKDAVALQRFIEWVSGREQDTIGVLFTPWGEAMIRRWYRSAMIRLSHLPQVRKVSIQTNLTGSLSWLANANTDKVALWTTFHPGQTTLEQFLGQCSRLDRLGVVYSVGVVGLNEYAGAIQRLRAALDTQIYVWINAYKREPDYYTAGQIKAFSEIDPLFATNLDRHSSRDEACYTGERVISVWGDGTITRCHFDKQPLGNLYNENIEAILRPRNCGLESCGCHIGYVHLKKLNLVKIFGSRILERVPIISDWRFTSGQFTPKIYD